MLGIRKIPDHRQSNWILIDLFMQEVLLGKLIFEASLKHLETKRSQLRWCAQSIAKQCCSGGSDFQSISCSYIDWLHSVDGCCS